MRLSCFASHVEEEGGETCTAYRGSDWWRAGSGAFIDLESPWEYLRRTYKEVRGTITRMFTRGVGRIGCQDNMLQRIWSIHELLSRARPFDTSAFKK